MLEAGMAKPEDFKGMSPDFVKPAGERCPHQRHSKGCAIYAKRPFGCRTWNCRWLVEDDTQDLKRPDRSHYVIDIMPDYLEVQDNETGGKVTTLTAIQIWVDPKYPDAHRDPALREYLERRGKEDMVAIIRYNSSDAFTIFPPSLSEDGQWHEVESKLDRNRSAGVMPGDIRITFED
jgi:hypothetical protein